MVEVIRHVEGSPTVTLEAMKIQNNSFILFYTTKYIILYNILYNSKSATAFTLTTVELL